MSFASEYPHLFKEFICEKNAGVDPFCLKPGSNKKVWWRCDKNHEYFARVSHRTLAGSRCPYCYGKKLSIDRSLAFKRPDLCREFHPTKNLPLSTDQIHASSRIKIWWRCLNNPLHVWISTVDNRNKGNGCPYCCGKRVDSSNSLASLNPELAKEWHPQLNHGIMPTDVSSYSNIKIWWQCGNRNYHIWLASVAHRSGGTSCPYCAENKLHIDDSALRILSPQTIKEWSPDLNPSVDFAKIHPGSRINVTWQCSNNASHRPWRATIYLRNRGRGRCPTCYPVRRFVKYYEESLEYKYPKLAKEWHSENRLLPNEVMPGSGIKIKWQCQARSSHVYLAAVHQRVSGHGCPLCTNAPTLPELRIYAELVSLYPDARLHHSSNGVKIDIFLPSIQTAIEWDSAYYHQEAFQRDTRKSQLLLNNHMHLIRIRHRDLPNLEIDQCRIIVVDNDEVSLEIMKELIRDIVTITNNFERNTNLSHYLSISDFINTDLYEKLRYNKGKPAPGQSLGEKYPDVYKIWHVQRNYPLTPNDVYPGSHEIVWWQCRKCNYDWRGSIAVRLAINSNGGRRDLLRCPNCTKSKPTPQYNLAKIFPDLVNEISLADNIGFNPNKVTPFSGKKIVWQCKRCAQKWVATITSRTRIGAGCPRCNGKILTYECSLAGKCTESIDAWDYEKNTIRPSDIFANTHAKYFFKCLCGQNYECCPKKFISGQRRCSSCTKSKPTPQYNLAKLFPDLIKEISLVDNIGFDPNTESPFSGKKIVWQCKKCYHKWIAIVLSRTRSKSGCPRCHGKILTPERSFAKKCPEAIGVWDYEKNKIRPDDIFAGTHRQYFFRCLCGNSYECRPQKFMLGQVQCKQCSRSM